MTPRQPTPTLRQLLAGGDRRSIAQSNRAAALLRANPGLLPQIAALARDKDWLVSLRALDLLEKVARERPESVEPFKKVFIGKLADSDKWEVRLQIVRALPLFDWTPAQRRRVVAILRRDVEHPQKFVRAWALDSLAQLAEGDPSLSSVVRRHLQGFERSGARALVARARKIRARLRPRGPNVLPGGWGL